MLLLRTLAEAHSSEVAVMVRRPRCFCQVEAARAQGGGLLCSRARCGYALPAGWDGRGGGPAYLTPPPRAQAASPLFSPVTYRQALRGGGNDEEMVVAPTETETREEEEEEEEEEEVLRCDCAGAPAAVARVSSTARNPGRQFWVCAKGRDDAGRCSFFGWEDELRRGPASSAPASSGKRPSSASAAAASGGAGKRPRAAARLLFLLHDVGALAAVVPAPAALPAGLADALAQMEGVALEEVAPVPGTLAPAATRVVVPVAAFAGVSRAGREAGVDVSCGVPEGVRAALEAYAGKEARRARAHTPEARDLMDVLPRNMCEKLMPFQLEGIHFALGRDGRALIGDDMGLGKTLQAIAIARVYRSDWPLLIVCPSSLRLNWKEELLKWLGEDIDERDINVVMKGADCARRLALVNIVSYDLCQKVPVRELHKCKFVICDESHYMKSRDTKRAKFVLPLATKANRALLLSGTPALSRPVELYSQVSAIEPELFPSYSAFTERYCNGHMGRWGYDVSGSANLGELHKILNGSLLIRRKKEDVLKQLPAKRRSVIWVETKSSVMKQVRSAQAELAAANAAIQEAQSEEEALSCRNAQRSANNKLYTLTGEAKLDAVQVFVKETLESTNGKLLVFGHHKEVLATLNLYVQKKLKTKTIMIDGSTNPAHRQGLCTTFQTDPSVRVAVLSITAAGVGLTLTAASIVIFAELYWNPGSLTQAEDRAHRIGQKDCVMIKYLLARDTLDGSMWDTVKRKLTVVGKSLTGIAAQMAVAQAPTAALDDGTNNKIDKYLGGKKPVAQDVIEDDDDDDGDVGNAGGDIGGPVPRRDAAASTAGAAAGQLAGTWPERRRDHFATAGPGRTLGGGSGLADGSRLKTSAVVSLESDEDDCFPCDLPTPPQTHARDNQHPVVHFDADLEYARRLQAEFDAEAGGRE